MKKILFLLIFASTQFTYAQQTLCFGATHVYTVDATDGPTGTSGSTYDWQVTNTGFAGTITSNANSATINWGATPAGSYVLQVTETNNGCIAAPVTLNVTINALPVAPTLSVDNAAICYDGDAVFTINGLPNAIVVYNVNSGADVSVTLDASGAASIPFSDATGNITVTITQITDSNGCVLSGLTITETVVVQPLVTTSPIGY